MREPSQAAHSGRTLGVVEVDLLHADDAEQPVEIADEVHLARGVADHALPVGEVLPETLDPGSVVEGGRKVGVEFIEIDRLTFPEPLILPLVFREPCVSLAQDRCLGLEEQTCAAGAAKRDSAGFELFDQWR